MNYKSSFTIIYLFDETRLKVLKKSQITIFLRVSIL